MGGHRHCAPYRPRITGLVAAFTVCLIGAGSGAAHAAPAEREATYVTLNLRDVPVSQAYAELAKQTGVAFRFKPATLWKDGKAQEPRVTVRLIQEPFWAAVDRINAQSFLMIQELDRLPAQLLTFRQPSRPGELGELQTRIVGAFYAVLFDRSTLVGAPPTGGPPRPRDVHISLTAEPRLRPLFWHSMQVERFIDDYGREIPNLVLLNPAAPRMVPFFTGPAYMGIRIDGPMRPMRVSRLVVTGKVMAGVNPETAVVTGVGGPRPVSGYAGGFRVDVERMPPNARGRLLRVNLTRVSGEGPAWLRPASRMFVLEPVVVDDKGRRVYAPAAEFKVTGRSCHIVVQLDTQPPIGADTEFGEPDRILLDIPSDVTDYDVRLEFADFELK